MNDATDARAGAKAPSVPAHGVSLREAFWTWMRVAALSFGGPAGQIAVMHRILVEEKRWVSEERFLHALNYCMLLPGPEAQQLATYIGWLMHRTLGGIMAGGLFILPGIISIMALSYVYAGWGSVPIVAALFFGLKAAVLAIVIEAVVRIGKRSLKNRALIALAARRSSASSFSACRSRSSSSAQPSSGSSLRRWAPRHFKAAMAMGQARTGARCRRRESARRADAGARTPDRCPRVAELVRLAGALADPGRRAAHHAGRLERLQPDRRLLQQDGDGDLRRRLCGARLCRPAGGRALRVAEARRNAGRTWAWPRRRLGR